MGFSTSPWRFRKRSKSSRKPTLPGQLIWRGRIIGPEYDPNLPYYTPEDFKARSERRITGQPVTDHELTALIRDFKERGGMVTKLAKYKPTPTENIVFKDR